MSKLWNFKLAGSCHGPLQVSQCESYLCIKIKTIDVSDPCLSGTTERAQAPHGDIMRELGMNGENLNLSNKG